MPRYNRLHATRCRFRYVPIRSLRSYRFLQCVANIIITDVTEVYILPVGIFSDLDNELDNRIHEIDRPVFEFRQRTGSSSYRALDSDLAGGTAVAGAENSRLEAQISASVAKKRAFDTIRKANHFLARQKQTDRILEDCIMEENATGDFCVPVCYMETSGEGGRTDKKVYSPIAGIDEGGGAVFGLLADAVEVHQAVGARIHVAAVPP